MLLTFKISHASFNSWFHYFNAIILFGWGVLMLFLLKCRRKSRLHIGQLVKDTSDKLKQASEIDHHVEVSVSFILWANCQFGSLGYSYLISCDTCHLRDHLEVQSIGKYIPNWLFIVIAILFPCRQAKKSQMPNLQKTFKQYWRSFRRHSGLQLREKLLILLLFLKQFFLLGNSL